MNNATVAQLVEHWREMSGVGGSKPLGCTKIKELGGCGIVAVPCASNAEFRWVRFPSPAPIFYIFSNLNLSPTAYIFS